MHARIQIYWCRSSIFCHLKLELLTQFPASNDGKYINVVYIWRKFVSFYGYVHWRMTTEISVMYGSEKVNDYSSKIWHHNDNFFFVIIFLFWHHFLALQWYILTLNCYNVTSQTHILKFDIILSPDYIIMSQNIILWYCRSGNIREVLIFARTKRILRKLLLLALPITKINNSQKSRKSKNPKITNSRKSKHAKIISSTVAWH